LHWNSECIDEIKRKLRNLKKLEMKIRFGYSFSDKKTAKIPQKTNLVWDEFFNISDRPSKAKYSLRDIASKSKEELREIVNEFFYNVYYKYYIENGIISSNLYDPEILNWMGLPPNAGTEDIKKRFRELAKKYHPDMGGDSKMFIELIENYKKLNLT